MSFGSSRIAWELDFWAATEYGSLANKKMHTRSWFQCFMFRQVKDLCQPWINYHLLFNRKMFNKLDRFSLRKKNPINQTNKKKIQTKNKQLNKKTQAKRLSFFQSPSPEGVAVQKGSIQLYYKHTLFVLWIPALSPVQLSTVLQKSWKRGEWSLWSNYSLNTYMKKTQALTQLFNICNPRVFQSFESTQC